EDDGRAAAVRGEGRRDAPGGYRSGAVQLGRLERLPCASIRVARARLRPHAGAEGFGDDPHVTSYGYRKRGDGSGMMDQGKREPMLEMFLYESNQLIEQLEQTILDVERSGAMTLEQINQIFRVMHTIKGSSAMMMYNHISELTHYAEDLFHYLRERPTAVAD